MFVSKDVLFQEENFPFHAIANFGDSPPVTLPLVNPALDSFNFQHVPSMATEFVHNPPLININIDNDSTSAPTNAPLPIVPLSVPQP